MKKFLMSALVAGMLALSSVAAFADEYVVVVVLDAKSAKTMADDGIKSYVNEGYTYISKVDTLDGGCILVFGVGE